MIFQCFEINSPVEGLEIVPAHPQREWMNASVAEDQHDPNKIDIGFANRCLPMLMVNQMGWNVVNKRAFIATSMPQGNIVYHWSEPQARFGSPINNFKEGNHVTWKSPWTFKTPPGWDLLILPPPNAYLPLGVTCLSALVETDHIPASFTFNWHVPVGRSIWVNPGDIVCRLVPYPTAELEKFSLEVIPHTQEGYPEWLVERTAALKAASQPGGKWAKLYWKEAKRLKIKRKSESGQDT